MIGLLTCLVLMIATVLSAEAVRVGCRRRLLTPVAVCREPAARVAERDRPVCQAG